MHNDSNNHRRARVSLPSPTSTSAALVTGASAGIGAALAGELAARGQNLLLVARRHDRLDALARDLVATHGIRAETISCDLSKAAPRGRLPGRIAQLGLDVEILVNNAGFATNGPFHEADPSRELEQVRVLVEAVVALSSAFIPAMVDRGRGAVLNVSSTAGMQPLPYSAGYSAAKAYVLTFSEALHHELKRHGVTVTALAPGPVTTDFWEISGWEVTGGQTFERATPRPVWISAEQAARAGINGLAAGNRVVVPHTGVRNALRAGRYVPHAVKLPIIERVMRPR
jgi:short-subunit dehydrogenase